MTFLHLCVILHGGRIRSSRDLKHATLAQLVERHFCKVDVLGSSPRGGSIINLVVLTDIYQYIVVYFRYEKN